MSTPHATPETPAETTAATATAATPTTATALLITPDETTPITATPLDISDATGHTHRCHIVNDTNTDAVFLTDVPAVAYVAAHSQNSPDHAHNPRATTLINAFTPGFAKRDHVRGIAIVLGLTPDGDLTDVPDSIQVIADRLFPTT